MNLTSQQLGGISAGKAATCVNCKGTAGFAGFLAFLQDSIEAISLLVQKGQEIDAVCSSCLPASTGQHELGALLLYQ